MEQTSLNSSTSPTTTTDSRDTSSRYNYGDSRLEAQIWSDDESDTRTFDDNLHDAVAQLTYSMDHCTTSRSSCSSCLSAFSENLEAAIKEVPTISALLAATTKVDGGINSLAEQVHVANVAKGLALLQLKHAATVFRRRARELQVHESMYHFALSRTDWDQAQIQLIENQARQEAINCTPYTLLLRHAIFP
jgi:hypothetical protein